MKEIHKSDWQSFQTQFFFDRTSGFGLDLSLMGIPQSFWAEHKARFDRAFKELQALEKGSIANPDEGRMVGHYWLRAPELAPQADIQAAIVSTLTSIKEFTARVHSKAITGATGKAFEHVLLVGIGGSALGPQFVNQALRTSKDPLDIYFFDNTDPDGMQRVLQDIPSLESTLVVVISKSGGTKETRNGQLIAKQAFEAANLDVGHHFVAVTGEGSELDKTALKEKWLARFPMWDWVGGRTSELSAVGLVPAALQGFDVTAMLAGARTMDVLTRVPEVTKNPAALMAGAWYFAGSGRGTRDLVVLPYKDRLELFSRYLQQLIMESLGKEHDLSGAVVNQGIAVYGNKGSTDQHAYVQQLRDGLANFFVTFIEVLRDSAQGGSSCEALEVESGITAGDYLSGFLLGTRQALAEKRRQSLTISITQVDAGSVGMLIALFERTVSIYASLIGINAYHQPGVEAGKKAAARVLQIQGQVVDVLKQKKGGWVTVEDVASLMGESANPEGIFRILRRLAANKRVAHQAGEHVFLDRYAIL